MSQAQAAGPRRAVKLTGDAISTLHEGRQAYLAVRAEGGPHVTPELYAWSSGRLWFAVASTTLKAKVLRRDPLCAAAVSAGDRTVLLRGQAESYDLRHPVELARHACRLPQVPAGLTTYTLRNAPDLLRFVTDTVTGRLGTLVPPIRVLHSLQPSAGLTIENDVVVDGWGTWSISGGPQDTRSDAPLGGESVVAALPGPVAVPARWFEADGILRVAPGLAAAIGGLHGRFPLSLVRDEYIAPGPAAKEGELLRGHGHLMTREPGAIRVELDRSVEWHGTVTTAQTL